MDRSVSTITREFQRNARFKYINNDKCLKPLMVCNKCQKHSYCTYIQAFYNYQELNKAEQTICRTFFTRPYRSNEKAECERNHETIRYCLPKGKSLNNLTQDQVNEMFSNINCLLETPLTIQHHVNLF